MLQIESIETFLDKLEKSLNKHLEKKKDHSSGRIFTGRKTVHDFNESQLSDLQAVRSESNTIRDRLAELHKTCKSAFRHSFSAM